MSTMSRFRCSGFVPKPHISTQGRDHDAPAGILKPTETDVLLPLPRLPRLLPTVTSCVAVPIIVLINFLPIALFPILLAFLVVAECSLDNGALATFNLISNSS